MPIIIFKDDMTLSFAENVLKPVFEYLSETSFKYESGGFILGSQVEDESAFIITRMTLPDKEDERGAVSFMRNRIPADKLISDERNGSNGSENYLGEWHTHNEDIPHPSITDNLLMRQVDWEKSCLFDHAFMIIFGNNGKAYVGKVDTAFEGDFTDSMVVDIGNGWHSKI